MEKKKLYESALFIFRRDLRLIDNTALINASKSSKRVIPAFFLDERQIIKLKNPYFSSNCIQFMLESIISQDNNLKEKSSKLFLFFGNLIYNLENLISTNKKIEAIFVNQDYTPFSIERDNQIKEVCKKHKIKFHSDEDLMLTKLREVMTPKGEFYKVYTPYSQAAMMQVVRKPDLYSINNFETEEEFRKNLNSKTELNEPFNINENEKEINFDSLTSNNNNSNNNQSKEIIDYNLTDLLELLKIKYNPEVEIKGGREAAYQIVLGMQKFREYPETRQFVKLPSTRLSAYLKFGSVSIREVYESILKNFNNNKTHELIKQLQWRDFFMKLTYFYPHVIGNSFKPECDHIIWQSKPSDIEAWKKGRTGFPIVDSAMRCLNKTGYIHNKLRTMVCSFLVKDVLADWRIGEQYFANMLMDYDISLNNGGWQWTGSTGTDPKGEPRMYNPVMQSEKLDPDCEFILKWIPELKDVSPRHIHDWEKYHSLYKSKVNYPDPIFCHYAQTKIAFKMFMDCKSFKNGKGISNEKDYQNNYNNDNHVEGNYVDNGYYKNKNTYYNKEIGNSNYSNNNRNFKFYKGDDKKNYSTQANYNYYETENNRDISYVKSTTNDCVYGDHEGNKIRRKDFSDDNDYSDQKNNENGSSLIDQRNNQINSMYQSVLNLNKEGGSWKKKNKNKEKRSNNASDNFVNMIYGAKNNPNTPSNDIKDVFLNK